LATNHVIWNLKSLYSRYVIWKAPISPSGKPR
jgi:hypothetical protein